MNKAQLVNKLADDIGVTNAEAGRMIGAFTEIIAAALASGDSVVVAGFGVFEAKQRTGRNGRNPLSGERIVIPAKRIPKFRPGVKLLEAVAK